jgi:branched-subunit amino acid aminotransferase/4-amino-4-deoxychorismate lyase
MKRLLNADEAFVTNALLGVAPLIRVNSRPIGRGTAGAVTEKLRKAYLTKLQLSCSANAKSV